jgi:DNA-binding beta-propeller fold protein YncE
VDINESKILLYASNYRTVTATLDDPGEYPVGVAYDAKTGVVGVTNIISTNDGSGSVSFYAKNATKPCVTLRKNHVASVYFAAFDATGNLYVNGKTDTGQVFIGVVSGECAATSITALSTKKPLGFPGGVQVAPDGNIAIGDQLSSTIDTYKPPVNGHLGVPITTTSLTDGGIAFVFSKSGKTLWAQGSSSVVEYAYPAGGAPLVTIGVEAAGIVVLPVAPPG